MRPPEIRSCLHVLAADLDAAGMGEKAKTLRTLAEETKRRRPVRKARPKAEMTDQTRNRIRDVARAFLNWSMFEVARACGVNQGQVGLRPRQRDDDAVDRALRLW